MQAIPSLLTGSGVWGISQKSEPKKREMDMKIYRAASALLLSLAFVSASSAEQAATHEFDVTVETGSAARVDAPVAFSIPGLSEERVAELGHSGRVVAWIERGGDNAKTYPVQLGRRAHFVMEGEEKAGVTWKGRLIINEDGGKAAAGADRFEFAVSEGEHEDLSFGGKKIWRYMTAYDADRHEETFKVFHHLYDFHGNGWITNGPEGTLPHHRGLFVGWNKTRVGDQEIDFWHMKPTGTTQKLVGIDEADTFAGPVFARRPSNVDWRDKVGKLMIVERRTITAYRQPGGKLLLDIDIHIESRAGEIQLSGDPQHAGFQFRARQEVFENQDKTRYVIPKGSERDDDDVLRGQWTTILFELSGHPYSVTYLAHPSNRHRDTAVFSTREYGRFGEYFATTLKEGEPLDMKYRLLLTDTDRHGEMTRERSQALFEDYVEPVKVTVEAR